MEKVTGQRAHGETSDVNDNVVNHSRKRMKVSENEASRKGSTKAEEEPLNKIIREKDLEIQRLKRRVEQLEQECGRQSRGNQIPIGIRLRRPPRTPKSAYSSIRGMIDFKALLKGRLVCKQWKDSIDKILQHICIDSSMEPFRIVPWNYLSFKLGVPVTNLKLAYDNKDKVVTLLGYLLEVQRWCPEYNPFPSGHLRIEISRAEYARGPFRLVSQLNWRFLTQIASMFLEAFGKHVLHLTLDILWIYNKEADFADEIGIILSTWLPFVPELKSLILTNEIVGSQKDNMQLFQSNSYTFPFLKHLELLIFTGWESINDFLSKFLKTNGHVRTVDICSHSSVGGIRNLDLVNLSGISLRVRGVKDLSELAQSTWNLNKLSLSAENEKYYLKINISFKQIAHSVNTFRNTLNVLSLNAAHVENLKEGTLVLPELRYLKLVHRDYGCVNWTNLLQGMNKLDTIDLQVGCDEYWRPALSKEKRKSFWKYVDNFWKTDSLHDWNKFPLLRNVKLAIVKDFEGCHNKTSVLTRPQMCPVRFETVITKRKRGGATPLY